MMYCSKCGSDLRGSKNSCPACGYSLNQMKTESAQKPVGYKHTEFKKESLKPVIHRDEDGNPISPYSDEGIRMREEANKPKFLTFKKREPSEEEGKS
jgi:ribosomal protein L37E